MEKMPSRKVHLINVVDGIIILVVIVVLKFLRRDDTGGRGGDNQKKKEEQGRAERGKRVNVWAAGGAIYLSLKGSR